MLQKLFTAITGHCKSVCILIGMVLSGCVGSTAPLDQYETEANLTIEDNRTACVERINALRATLDLPPYERWEAGESCADDSAKNDALRDQVQSSFRTCDEQAQNECNEWETVDDVFDSCFQAMWDEGLGKEDANKSYENMAHESYTRVACGFYVTKEGMIWSVQNFQ